MKTAHKVAFERIAASYDVPAPVTTARAVTASPRRSTAAAAFLPGRVPSGYAY